MKEKQEYVVWSDGTKNPLYRVRFQQKDTLTWLRLGYVRKQNWKNGLYFWLEIE